MTTASTGLPAPSGDHATTGVTPTTDARCRLCGGSLDYRFAREVLRRHRVAYYRCADCESLQTEAPHWIAEAYDAANLSDLDTGAAQRNLDNLAACYVACRLFDADDVVDVGGGDGLLCRLLRDREINCYVRDKYASPTYAQGFTEPDFDVPDLVVGFEVMEHFVDVEREIDELFATGARVMLLSTQTYSSQDERWWYLAPESGQHVFFYSMKALFSIAARHGYALGKQGDFVLFVRDASKVRVRIAEALLGPRVLRLVKAWLATRPTGGIWKDHQRRLARSRD